MFGFVRAQSLPSHFTAIEAAMKQYLSLLFSLVVFAWVGIASPGHCIATCDEPNDAPIETPNVAEAINAGARYLFEQQSKADGGWHSEYYGSMKQGSASTGLVVYAIGHLPESILKKHDAELKQVSRFIKRRIQKEGCVGNQDGSLDYPIYCTAMILSANKKLELGITETDANRMLSYLFASQCLRQRGFAEDNVNHGGWDILGPAGPDLGKTPGANVSVTFYATEAIEAYADQMKTQSKSALADAQKWCRAIGEFTQDEGFYFSAIRSSPLNKAGISLPGRPRSYGSATHDGLGILLNTGVEVRDSRLQKSVQWLNQNESILVPGFVEDQKKDGAKVKNPWPKALQYYYLAACSRNIGLLGNQAALKKKIIKHLCSAQQKDGSWRNEFAHMREDDPLIATSYALIALCNLQSAK